MTASERLMAEAREMVATARRYAMGSSPRIDLARWKAVKAAEVYREARRYEAQANARRLEAAERLARAAQPIPAGWQAIEAGFGA